MPLPSVSPFAIYSDTLRAYALLASGRVCSDFR